MKFTVHLGLCRVVPVLLWLIGNSGDCSQEEDDLYEYLQEHYNVLERPVGNSSRPVTVHLGVILQQLINVDEKNQIIEVNAALKYTWTDYKLRWEKDLFGGISDVRFPSDKIWKPDVLLYNSVDSNFDSTYAVNTIVYSDGTVSWMPPGIFKISCKIDIRYFPFDDQICFFKFGSWTYDGFKLDLQPDAKGLDTSEYLENGEWALPNTSVLRSEKFYECCPEPYPDLKFYLLMRRRTLYYGFNLIMPCIMTTLMTLLGFTLPPDAGEKITLQITVLLSICLFLSIVSEMTPPTSEAVPLLGIFFSCCMLVVTASTVATVYVLNLHFRTPETHKMGRIGILSVICMLAHTVETRAVMLHWLPWVLAMHRPGYTLKYSTLPNPFKRCTDEERTDGNGESLIRNIKVIEEDTPVLMAGQAATAAGKERDSSVDVERRIAQCLKLLSQNSLQHHLDIGQQAQLLIMQRIYTELKFITRRMTSDDDEAFAENEWKFAAMAFDRLSLYVFLVFIVGSTCVILFSAPYLIA